jgi:hypothetical protein
MIMERPMLSAFALSIYPELRSCRVIHWNFDHNGSAANMEELTSSKSFLKWHGFSRI